MKLEIHSSKGNHIRHVSSTGALVEGWSLGQFLKYEVRGRRDLVTRLARVQKRQRLKCRRETVQLSSELHCSGNVTQEEKLTRVTHHVALSSSSTWVAFVDHIEFASVTTRKSVFLVEAVHDEVLKLVQILARRRQSPT